MIHPITAAILGAAVTLALGVIIRQPAWTPADVRMAYKCGVMRMARERDNLGPADAATEAECTRLNQAGLTEHDIAIGKCFDIYNRRPRAQMSDEASNAEAERKMWDCFERVGETIR